MRCHDTSEFAHLVDTHLLATPVLALDDAHGRAIGLVLRIEPDVDAAICSVRLSLRDETSLLEELFDESLETSPFDDIKDNCAPLAWTLGAGASIARVLSNSRQVVWKDGHASISFCPWRAVAGGVRPATATADMPPQYSCANRQEEETDGEQWCNCRPERTCARQE